MTKEQIAAQLDELACRADQIAGTQAGADLEHDGSVAYWTGVAMAYRKAIDLLRAPDAEPVASGLIRKEPAQATAVHQLSPDSIVAAFAKLCSTRAGLNVFVQDPTAREKAMITALVNAMNGLNRLQQEQR